VNRFTTFGEENEMSDFDDDCGDEFDDESSAEDGLMFAIRHQVNAAVNAVANTPFRLSLVEFVLSHAVQAHHNKQESLRSILGELQRICCHWDATATEAEREAYEDDKIPF